MTDCNDYMDYSWGEVSILPVHYSYRSFLVFSKSFHLGCTDFEVSPTHGAEGRGKTGPVRLPILCCWL